MKVYVRNQDGAPLMPCTPAKARKLLRAGAARVIARSPFTIQLAWQCEGQTQDVVVGIDKGSNVTGISCVGNGKVLLAVEVHHRRDVKEKLDTRRAHRKSRRARKWYRPLRFANRASSKRSGRLPPSIKTNVEEVIRVVRQLPLPISHIVVEDVQVDIARLNNPDLHGSQYQDPTRLNENLRIACLMRDDYRCYHCGKRNGRLEAHHIVYREHGGKDDLPPLLVPIIMGVEPLRAAGQTPAASGFPVHCVAVPDYSRAATPRSPFAHRPSSRTTPDSNIRRGTSH